MLSNTIKQIFIAILSSITAALTSVQATFAIMLIMFTADFFFGIISGWIVNGEGFRWKKGLVAGIALVIYASIAALAAIIGHLMDDITMAQYAVKAITYIYIYITGTNTLKNLCRIFPSIRLFHALYWLLSFEFARKFPELHKNLTEKKEIEN
jgi:hypothetical protein